jgi:outer membrane protein assembly factor BamB
VDIYGVMPCDDPDNGNVGGRPDPTQQITGSIDGDDLNIVIGDGNEAEAGEVIVIDPETGEIIIDEEFVGQTSVTIPEPGAYTAYVVTDGGTYAGEFVVE